MGTKENGYIKAAAVTLKTTVADCEKNSFEIIKYIDEARCKCGCVGISRAKRNGVYMF